MSVTASFWKWSAIGLIVTVALIGTQAVALGGMAGLLQVGENSALRPLVEDKLGSVPLAQGLGHDGQIFYAMGVDLNGSDVGPLLDHASYRYRRILYPLIASLFGLLDGWALIYGMVAVAALSMALSAGLVAAMAVRSGRSELLALAVVLNPGLWLSVRLLTADTLMLLLMLAGLYAFTLQAGTQSASAFTLSALAKDVSLATPIPLGLRFREWKSVLLPVAAMAPWVIYLTLRFGGGFSPRGNLDWPFAGLTDAVGNWSGLGATELIYLAFALLSVVLGAFFSLRRSWLRWPLVAWTALAILSSSWVWDYGNNAARALAPIVVLVALTGVYAETGRGAALFDSRTQS